MTLRYDFGPAPEPRSNLLVNPSFEQWWRGNGPFTAAGAYGPDRWVIVRGTSTLSVSRDATNQDAGSVACAACTYVHTDTARLCQNCEDYLQLRGRTVALSIRVRTATAGSVRPYVWDSVSGFRYGGVHPGGGVYATLVVVADVAAAATGVQVGVDFLASATVYVDSATCHVGPAARPFEPLPPGEEVIRCQRYYEAVGSAQVNHCHGVAQAASATACYWFCHFRPKVATPTVTVSAAADFKAGNATTSVYNACSAVTAGGIGPGNCYLAGTTTGLVAGNASLILAATTTARVNVEAN